MKKSLIAVCFGVWLFAGCKEVPPDITSSTAAVTDTTYVGPVPSSTDAHNVLAEEFSGQSCSNCPQGHAVLDTYSVHNPGKLNTIVYYQNGGGLVDPPAGAIYDFRTAAALALGNAVFPGAGGQLPSGGIDRVPYSGSIVIGYPDWTAAITNELSVPDSLNLAVSSTYTGSVATIIATMTYTKAMATHQNLSLIVVADSMIDIQETHSGATPGYVFNDVFVGMVTAIPLGDPILDTMAVKEAGRVVKKVYSYTLPAFAAGGIPSPAHCRVIAFVNAQGTGGDYHVLQSVQCKLMGP